MFYYLGRKKRIAGLYPEPQYDTVIEPFAGSAAYSLHGNRWKNNVIINDLSPITCSVWRYLQNATKNDIDSLPEPVYGQRLSSFVFLSEEERWLISFHINPGANQRSDCVTKFNRWPAGKRYISNNLYKIKHWKLIEGSYLDIENYKATWFIDPPYCQVNYYMTNDVNYDELATFTKTRSGQVIVCEQNGAYWLPFVPLTSIAIAGKNRSNEVIWLNGDQPNKTSLFKNQNGILNFIK